MVLESRLRPVSLCSSTVASPLPRFSVASRCFPRSRCSPPSVGSRPRSAPPRCRWRPSGAASVARPSAGKHVLDRMDDARLAGAPFAAHVLEVLRALFLLETRPALVQERRRQQQRKRLLLVQRPRFRQGQGHVHIRRVRAHHQADLGTCGPYRIRRPLPDRADVAQIRPWRCIPSACTLDAGGNVCVLILLRLRDAHNLFPP
ncbi:uncharacterized protein PG998_014247 [Apiospora kogelbergensis]|uniref:uncharacterized protein n=1 Tax=Apiospora kogelbergensis TaxID=1337665 RepID=UPI00312CDDB7